MASVIEQAQQMYRQGEIQQMLDLMQQAAEQKDSACQLQLAKWLFSGQFVEQNPARAKALLDQSVALGNVHGMILKANMLAHGKSGYDRNWSQALALLAKLDTPHANRQRALLAKMSLDDQGNATSRFTPEKIKDGPVVYRVSGAVSVEECDYIATIANPRLEPSSVVDANGQRRPHPVRNSFGTSFGPLHEDLVIHAINRRIALASGTDVDAGEPLHILRYESGQQYKPHFDAIPGERNQRTKTVLLYLNDNYQGGETRFTDADFAVKGQQGDLLIFDNLTDEQKTEPLSKHAGLPVTQGQKWLATRWIRQHSYSPW